MNSIDILNTERPSLIKYLIGLGCSYHNAEDIIQNIYVKTLRIKCENPNRFYFYVAAKNGYIDLKSKRKKEVLISDHTYFENNILVENKYIDEKNNILVVLNSLPQKSRKALYMLYWENKSRKEIGAILGLTESGVKNLIQRAKNKIRKILEQEKIS